MRRAVTKASPGVQRAIDAYYQAYVRRFNAPEVASAWLADPRGQVLDPVRRTMRAVEKEDVVLPIISGGKDGKNLKEMIAVWGEEAVVSLCAEFPFIRDARVEASDYSLGALRYLAQRLMLMRRGKVSGAARDRSSDNRLAVDAAVSQERE